jgi:hypothetical protein
MYNWSHSRTDFLTTGIRFDRRFRIYDISDFGETIQTYKRLANDEIIDRMVLAGRGAPDPNVS